MKKYGGGQTVYCNCDDPTVSNFFQFFSTHFERLRLKKLITTCYQSQECDLFSRHDCAHGLRLEYTGDRDGNRVPDPHEIGVYNLQGDGDFASEECIKLLKESDIVVTNPPFSKFRVFLKQLMRYDKKFLIVGDMNVITYKDVFPLIKENLIWSGLTRVKELETPGNSAGKSYFCQKRERWFQKFGKVGWYTNLPHHRRNEELVLYRTYSSEKYPHYDNYDAINVDWVKDIPKDWDGAMGVPISFLDKHNPEQFEIIGLDRPLVKRLTGKQSRFILNGKEIYARIVIRNKQVRQ